MCGPRFSEGRLRGVTPIPLAPQGGLWQLFPPGFALPILCASPSGRLRGPGPRPGAAVVRGAGCCRWLLGSLPAHPDHYACDCRGRHIPSHGAAG